MPLLVRPAGHVDAASQGARHLQAVHHAHRAIQPAGMRLGFQVAADQQERPLPSPAADDVADAVDLGVEPGLGQPRGEPVPRLDVLRRVGRPVHPGAIGADRPQRLQVIQQPLRHRSCSWRHRHALRPDQPVRRRNEAGDLVAQRPQPSRVVQHDVRPVVQIQVHHLAIRRLALPPRRSRRAPWPAARRTPGCSICPSSGSRRIAARSPRCRPGRAGRSRSPPSRRSCRPAPAATCAFASAAWSFTIEPRLVRHRLQHLARLLLDRAVADQQGERRMRHAGLLQQRLGLGEVARRHRMVGVPVAAARRLELVRRDELAVGHHLAQRARGRSKSSSASRTSGLVSGPLFGQVDADRVVRQRRLPHQLQLRVLAHRAGVGRARAAPPCRAARLAG